MKNNLNIYRQLVTQINRQFYPYHRIEVGQHIVPKNGPDSSFFYYKQKSIICQLLNGIPLKNKNRLTDFLFDEILLQYLDFKWVQDLIMTKTTSLILDFDFYFCQFKWFTLIYFQFL